MANGLGHFGEAVSFHVRIPCYRRITRASAGENIGQIVMITIIPKTASSAK
jgi:hypothetical protein